MKKTAIEFENCKLQLFTLTICLPVSLVSSVPGPISIHDHSSNMHLILPVSNDDWLEIFKFIWALAWENAQTKLNLLPILSRLPCSSVPLCCWPLFSLFSGALCLSFSRCSSLVIRRFVLVFSCPLWYSSQRVSTCFLRCFSLSLPFSRLASTLILLALSVSAYFNPKRFHQKLELKWFLSIQHSRFSYEYYCFVFWLETSNTENRWCFQLPTNQYDFPLKTRVINSFLARLHIYLPTWSHSVMPN